MGFDEINKTANRRIQQIAYKFTNDTITEKERNELATLIYPKLKFYIWKFCKNNDDTEEALQWTLKKIFKNVSKFDFNRGRFTTWIYTIARNETLFYLHVKNKVSYVNIENGSTLRSTMQETDDMSDVEGDFQNLYNITLSEIYGIEDTLLKNIAIDKMINKDKVKNIASRYDINENTVKTKLRKVRIDLKDKILNTHPSFKESLNNIFNI
jgi:RNA polymerase sigma-70 factor (ECF subfamily)